MTDIIIIGGGPAGLSAAINARTRGKSVLIVSNPISENPLYKAPVIDNYPGLPGISGKDYMEQLEAHAREMGTQFLSGRVLAIAPMGDRFFVSIGNDFKETRAVILAIGAQRGAKLPGEEIFLGRGVSWCATCDGMLYRGKEVAVVGLSHDAPAEANFLQEIGCKVTYIAHKTPDGLRPDIPMVLGKKLSVEGETASMKPPSPVSAPLFCALPWLPTICFPLWHWKTTTSPWIAPWQPICPVCLPAVIAPDFPCRLPRLWAKV